MEVASLSGVSVDLAITWDGVTYPFRVGGSTPTATEVLATVSLREILKRDRDLAGR